MKTTQKLIQDIKPGDIVAGRLDGWWEITSVDICLRSKTVLLPCLNVDDGHKGLLHGSVDDVRIVKVGR